MNNKETKSEGKGGRKERKWRLIRGWSCVHASFQLKHFLPLSFNPIFLSAPYSPSVSLPACVAARALSKIFFVTSFLCRWHTVWVCKYEKIETSALLSHSSYT